MDHGFKESDEGRYVEALNFIANRAKFEDVDTVKGAIELYKHFNFLQSLVSKINANILEVRALHTPDKED
jgi:hypothetical protein